MVGIGLGILRLEWFPHFPPFTLFTEFLDIYIRELQWGGRSLQKACRQQATDTQCMSQWDLAGSLGKRRIYHHWPPLCHPLPTFGTTAAALLTRGRVTVCQYMTILKKIELRKNFIIFFFFCTSSQTQNHIHRDAIFIYLFSPVIENRSSRVTFSCKNNQRVPW